MAGTLRQSETQSVILESHTSLFKATHFRSIQGHTKAPILNMSSVLLEPCRQYILRSVKETRGGRVVKNSSGKATSKAALIKFNTHFQP